MGDKSTAFTGIRSIKIDNNKHIDFTTPKIMGILNITPDSFYDGGKYTNTDCLLAIAESMLNAGADIIDIGAVSTRPGAENIGVDEELKRIIVPLELLINSFPEAIFSIDTYRSKVACETIGVGAHIINDISGGTMDDQMFTTIAKLKVPYILMHIHGTPETMQHSPIRKNVVGEVVRFFNTSVDKLSKLGVEDIILDPGFGFGKTLDSNYTLLSNIDKIRVNNLPVLAGVSRKSMISKVLKLTPDRALNGTTVLNTIALLNGANLLRVHDVEEANECIKLISRYKNTSE
ncbi:MAG: dihydropteroate synthase [Bacteroidetes bacterium]|nr:dihydropteroate synthase [Bacteroidota bacterium]